MKYSSEKIENAKVLAGEILELNQILPDDHCVMFEITGMFHPSYMVTFCVRNPKTMVFTMERSFAVLLSEVNKENRFDEIRAYMNKWKESYCR